MNLQEITKQLESILNELKSLQEDQLNEMTMYPSKLSFSDFRDEMLKPLDQRKYKAKDGQNNISYKEINNIRITSNCIQHVQKDHPETTLSTWTKFLQIVDPQKDYKVKCKVNGKTGQRYAYKCYNDNSCYGYVLDTFDNKNPLLVTMFTDHENSIDNWLNNESLK